MSKEMTNQNDILKFKKSELLKLLSKLSVEFSLQLVGDEGIYIMSFEESLLPRTPSTVVYAEGCNPRIDSDYYENKERLFGGDDASDTIGTVSNLYSVLDECDTYLFVIISPTSISISNRD